MRKISTKGRSVCILGGTRVSLSLSAFSLSSSRLLLPPPLLLLSREEVATVNTALESCTIYESAPVPRHRCVAGTINRRIYCQGSKTTGLLGPAIYEEQKINPFFFSSFPNSSTIYLFRTEFFLAKT